MENWIFQFLFTVTLLLLFRDAAYFFFIVSCWAPQPLCSETELAVNFIYFPSNASKCIFVYFYMPRKNKRKVSGHGRCSYSSNIYISTYVVYSLSKPRQNIVKMSFIENIWNNLVDDHWKWSESQLHLCEQQTLLQISVNYIISSIVCNTRAKKNKNTWK